MLLHRPIFFIFWWTIYLLWGHWYPCFGFLVTSLLGFKARVGSALFALSGGVCYMFSEILLWCYMCQPLGSWQHSQSLPNMHQQRWDLAPIRTDDHPYRRRSCYHCASDPTVLYKYLRVCLDEFAHFWLKISVSYRCLAGDSNQNEKDDQNSNTLHLIFWITEIEFFRNHFLSITNWK